MRSTTFAEKAERKEWHDLRRSFRPIVMEEMIGKGMPEQIDRLTQAFLPINKFDIAKPKQAHKGEQEFFVEEKSIVFRT